MGQFTSLCKQCDTEIHWFIHLPKNFHCERCGTYNSPEEIQVSWHEYYDTYQEVFKYFHTHTLEQVKEMFKDNRNAMVILNKTAWKT